MDVPVLLIVGSARAGTTALARVLDTATNAEIHVEHHPKLCLESRSLREGRLDDPTRVLREAKSTVIEETLARGLRFGDKNPNYLEFLPYLPAEWNAHVLFVVRDGRDVVRSLMDWHRFKGVIYNTPEDTGLSHSKSISEWDLSWPRPATGDPGRPAWTSLSRFEKCAWYWSHFYSRVRTHIGEIPEDRRSVVDMTRATPTIIHSVFERLGLEGFEASKIERLLEGRINSLADRTGEADTFPGWGQWDPELTRQFDHFAKHTLTDWGYR